ncbi:hypothetical protein C3L33_00509, partial [Rhododendron williamsianum]
MDFSHPSPLSRRASSYAAVPFVCVGNSDREPIKGDDEQWLAYWIIYSFLTLMEMLLQPVLEWYDPRKKTK